MRSPMEAVCFLVLELLQTPHRHIRKTVLLFYREGRKY